MSCSLRPRTTQEIGIWILYTIQLHTNFPAVFLYAYILGARQIPHWVWVQKSWVGRAEVLWVSKIQPPLYSTTVLRKFAGLFAFAETYDKRVGIQVGLIHIAATYVLFFGCGCGGTDTIRKGWVDGGWRCCHNKYESLQVIKQYLLTL